MKVGGRRRRAGRAPGTYQQGGGARRGGRNRGGRWQGGRVAGGSREGTEGLAKWRKAGLLSAANLRARLATHDDGCHATPRCFCASIARGERVDGSRRATGPQDTRRRPSLRIVSPWDARRQHVCKLAAGGASRWALRGGQAASCIRCSAASEDKSSSIALLAPVDRNRPAQDAAPHWHHWQLSCTSPL